MKEDKISLKKGVGAMCIVLAMVFTALVGFVQAQSGIVSVSPDMGTRGEVHEATSLITGETIQAIDDGNGNRIFPETAIRDASAPVAVVENEPTELYVDGGKAVAQMVRKLELFESPRGQITYHSEKGTITVGTRAGEIDAGGPYGGPDCYEGTCTIRFTVTVNDPSIIMFRFDWDNDGVFDYPEQTSAGLLGDWVTTNEFDYTFYDNFYSDIVVEGWDGVSTYIVINTGDHLGEATNWNLSMGMFGGTWRLVGNSFKAKKPITVTELGYYQYPGRNGYKLYFWVFGAGQPKLGQCEPAHTNFQWNWCTLPTSFDLVTGEQYWLGIRIDGSFQGWTPAPAGLNSEYLEHMGMYGSFCYDPTPDTCKETFNWGGTNYAATVDFRFREILILPDTVSDTSHLDVRNVAPDVFGIRTDPSPGLEGTPISFIAEFDDPGRDDTWEYRWTTPTGTTPWRTVDKMSGGANVLVIHSNPNMVSAIGTEMQTVCGSFCKSIDFLNYYSESRVPSLDELLPYDVVIVMSNYGVVPDWDAMGDLLADFMDDAGPTGGGVVMMLNSFYNGATWGVRGRWQNDLYAPIPLGGYGYYNAPLSNIYVPGHPILDGVASMSATYRGYQTSVNPGATYVAGFSTGHVGVAVNENPVVPNGARSVALPWWCYASYAGGDYMRLTVNAIKWASRQPDPEVKTMPIELAPYKIIMMDDHPQTTTPVDPVPVSVEVRDDDDGKFIVYSQDELSSEDFDDATSCYYASSTLYSWPTGWSVDPSHGWRCEANPYYFSRAASVLYYYNDPLYGSGDGISHLYSPSYDTTGYNALRLELDTEWDGSYSAGDSNGYIRASIDGGATYPILLQEYHNMNPSFFAGHLSLDRNDLGGYPSVKFRFTYESADDYWWFLDNIVVTVFDADTIAGLGSVSGTAMVANVPPTIEGGFDTAWRYEAQGLDFKGFTLKDPALMAPTEWFAYSWNMGDGTPTEWTYKGTMTPPKFDVLLIHSLDFSGCGFYCNAAKNMMLGLKDVASVDDFNFFYPSVAPSLTLMMNYDVIMVAFNYGWNSDTNWDLAKRLTGDRIAAYMEAGRGGVVTWHGVHWVHASYPQIWDLMGRYIDWDYGPYERAAGVQSTSALGPIFEPGHDVMAGVSSGQVTFQYARMGDNDVTTGGLGIAAGIDGLNLADNAAGGRGIGAKELSNGARAVHIGAFMGPYGADMSKLVYNAIGWAAGGIPNPNLKPFNYEFGDDGIYTVELNVIDDDMGYVWDAVNNVPVEVIPGIPYAKRTMTVTVDNVDPTIASDVGDFEAFIASTVCVRVSGTSGNSVTAEVYEDGVLVSSTSTVRLSDDPNPPDEKCGLFKIDVLESHSYEAVLTYSAPSGGSNPTWLIFNPWRDPVTPGHGTVSWKYDFETDGEVVPQSLSTLKTGLLDSGHGAKIDFAAEAYDPGTDDLAFLWIWGAVSSIPYGIPNDPTMSYEINVHHNNGMPTSDGTLADPQHLGFSEPFFDRAANTGLSPLGTTNYRVRDTATHAFDMEQSMYYVTLIVFDDDNGRGYPSPFMTDGIDMDFIFLDLS